MAIFKWNNFICYIGFWIALFNKNIFRILVMKIKYAQMAKQLDATSKTCSTEVGTSANLVLGTIDDYILQGKIVPFPAIRNLN
tara:strand:- start:68 stop:316 length:249 start_codon:yes stop_codon:yes gene_type:complete